MDQTAARAQGIYDLAARQSQGRDYCRAAHNFRLAARHFAEAGDARAADEAMFQAGFVQADCKDQQAANAGTIRQEERRAHQSCVPYFQAMRKMFRDNAAICLKETRLLQSLTDMAGKNQTSRGDPTFTRASAPELFAILDLNDPGWTMSATHASPRCKVSLRVDSQDQAFSECARVYLCGAAAAYCGLQRARQDTTGDCVSISHACLAQHPVPQSGGDPPPERDAWEPRVTVSPSPARRKPHESTITGRSGPNSGGGSSSGVTSAR
jgi:hypothetical protein